jgi:hypothetical protein
MIKADIKGKLSLNELYSEDFLTSALFSAFIYMEDKWINKYLNQAKNIEGDKLCIELNNPKYDFWAYFGAIKETGWGTEPDVIIYSNKTAIIIEAKNYSGKSGEGVLQEEKSDDLEIIDIKKIADQLGREYFVGRKSLEGCSKTLDEEVFNIEDPILIYLTRHSSFPKDEIKTTINAIRDINPDETENAEKKIYWLNWQKAMPIFEEIIETESKSTAEYKISKDMVVFLERRNLGIFSGFDFLDNFIVFSKELENLLSNKYLFYKKVFKPYWMFIKDIKPFPRTKKDNVFYKIISIPYWNFIRNELEFNSEPVFYTISYKPYWKNIIPFIDFQIRDEIFYKG